MSNLWLHGERVKRWTAEAMSQSDGVVFRLEPTSLISWDYSDRLWIRQSVRGGVFSLTSTPAGATVITRGVTHGRDISPPGVPAAPKGSTRPSHRPISDMAVGIDLAPETVTAG